MNHDELKQEHEHLKNVVQNLLNQNMQLTLEVANLQALLNNQKGEDNHDREH